LSLVSPVPDLKPQLLGPPRSGFEFTADERALIIDAAPSIDGTDRHGIPIVDVTCAYFVDDHVEQLREFALRPDNKAVRRELGATAQPNRQRRRDPARLSDRVVHILAARLLLCDGNMELRAHNIDPIVRRIRAGEIPESELRRAAREALALGALKDTHNRLPGKTTHEPFWLLASNIFNVWRFGLGRAIILSEDPSRKDGEHQGVHSELVCLTQALHEIAVRRLWQDENFKRQTAHDPIVIKSRSEAYHSLKLVRKSMLANDTEGTGRGFTVLRRPKQKPHVLRLYTKWALRRLRRDVFRARYAAWRWIMLGKPSRRSRKRSRSKPRRLRWLLRPRRS